MRVTKLFMCKAILPMMIKPIATNLPGFVIHDPTLSLEESSGNDFKSIFLNSDIVLKFKKIQDLNLLHEN